MWNSYKIIIYSHNTDIEQVGLAFFGMCFAVMSFLTSPTHTESKPAVEVPIVALLPSLGRVKADEDRVANRKETQHD